MNNVLNLYNSKRNSRLFNGLRPNLRFFRLIIKTIILKYNRIVIFLILNIVTLIYYR